MHVLAVVVYFQSLVNMAMAFHIIFTRGVGKSGSTVAVSQTHKHLLELLLLDYMYMYKCNNYGQGLNEIELIFFVFCGLFLCSTIVFGQK